MHAKKCSDKGDDEHLDLLLHALFEWYPPCEKFIKINYFIVIKIQLCQSFLRLVAGDLSSDTDAQLPKFLHINDSIVGCVEGIKDFPDTL